MMRGHAARTGERRTAGASLIQRVRHGPCAAVTRYRLESVFELAASAPAVHAALVEPEPWLARWPEARVVRRVRPARADGGGGCLEGVIRAPLGYRVRGRLETVVTRPPTLLVMRVTGSIRGTAVWRIEPVAAGVRVRVTLRVRPTRLWLRLASVVARPVLVAGHDAVVRRAVAAMAAHLRTEAFELARPRARPCG